MESMQFVNNTQEGRSEQFPVGMRVLAVDDNPTCLRKLEELLLRCKYHVTKTMEPKKAIELLREKSNMFDLVISDVEMPDTDGFKLLEIGLEMDLPVIMLSAHGDYDSVMKGIIHGACDYLIKPVGYKELRNIWQHVVKKNINSYKKNLGPSRQLPPPPAESHLAPGPNVTKKRKDKADDSGGDEESGRDEESGEWSEQDGDESSTRKKPRVVWSQELHQKFVTAVQQLGLEKAVPKKILDYMNIEGLTRENVASHLQKYRLYLKKIDEGQQNNMSSQDSSYFQMAQLDGLRDYTSTRQLPSSALLTRSHLTKFHPSVYSSINLQESNSPSFNQLQNSSNSANPFGTYNRSLLDPLLQFPRNKSSAAYMGDFKGIGDRAFGSGGGFFGSQMSSFASSSNSLPNGSSSGLMLPGNYTQPLGRASDGNQSFLEGGLFNSGSSSMNANGLPRLPNHSWQGNLKTNRFPSDPSPLTHGFGQDQLSPFAGNGLDPLVSGENPIGGMQCEPQLLSDFVQNMNNDMMSNPFGNVEYPPLPATIKEGLDKSVMRPIDDIATTLNNGQDQYFGKPGPQEMNSSGKSETAALVDSGVFDDIMNEMMRQEEGNGMAPIAARFGFDSFPPP